MNTLNELKTIREALEILESVAGGPYSTSKVSKALAALTQLEAMAGEQESSLAFYKRRCDALQQWQSKMRDPERTIVCDILANGHTLEPAGDRYAAPPAQQYEAGDVASAAAQGFRDGVASVAQQPQKLEDIEQYRMRMAGICTAAIGYWKEGDPIHPDYDTPALRDVAKLYAKYDALYKAQQPQAECRYPRCDDCGDTVPKRKCYCRAGCVHEAAPVAQQPQADSIPVAAFDRLMALCESQAQRIIELEDKQPQAGTVPSDVVRDADLALDLLSKLFDAYENGLACYEDPDEQAGYVGNAVELDADTIHACADLLNRRRPIAAIAQQKGQP